MSALTIMLDDLTNSLHYIQVASSNNFMHSPTLINYIRLLWKTLNASLLIYTRSKLLAIDDNGIEHRKIFFMFLTNVVPKVSTLV